MATMAEAPDENTIAPPSPPPSHSDYSAPLSQSRIPADATPWIDYAIEQARVAQKTVEETLDFAISTTRSRLDRFLSTGSAHLHTTVDSLQDLKSDYVVYEDMVFGKIKEGIIVAASHPVASCSAAVGLGFLALKRPRRFLYYNTLRLFSNEEALLSRADTKVKELRQSIDLLKAESEKLEVAKGFHSGLELGKVVVVGSNRDNLFASGGKKRALQAEEELTRGRIKLRQAGKQIQGVIHSACKIERQAGGLKDNLGELPRREASRFRSQVSNLASEAKRERNTLTKEVSKISNYGISV
ncbi:hypothetical protein RHMOL_Rhmol01G0191600 [Rhododendron molle]|uniref:Uncharacterized protein n=1 Tax=Rhododendron molle TaxID=49168 RepID=A0ACC0Q505_RHOML|nr:hypothetical protein RHMOL_Rhmol01G0191600 [Rhododendron molle]